MAPELHQCMDLDFREVTKDIYIISCRFVVVSGEMFENMESHCGFRKILFNPSMEKLKLCL